MLTWIFRKSTLLKSFVICFICAGLCKTALAAWAKWFKEVYLLNVWAKALMALSYKQKMGITLQFLFLKIWELKLNFTHIKIYILTFMFKISSPQCERADFNQPSKLFAKFRMAWVSVPNQKTTKKRFFTFVIYRVKTIHMRKKHRMWKS